MVQGQSAVVGSGVVDENHSSESHQIKMASFEVSVQLISNRYKMNSMAQREHHLFVVLTPVLIVVWTYAKQFIYVQTIVLTWKENETLKLKSSTVDRNIEWYSTLIILSFLVIWNSKLLVHIILKKDRSIQN